MLSDNVALHGQFLLEVSHRHHMAPTPVEAQIQLPGVHLAATPKQTQVSMGLLFVGSAQNLLSRFAESTQHVSCRCAMQSFLCS